MNGPDVRIGSRGSALALAQAELTISTLQDANVLARLVIVETAGDRRSPDTAWGEGAFVAAIERELLAGRIDIAVHSAKDVPIEVDPRLRIGAYLPRADPRDALVVRPGFGRTLDNLPLGARVGTDSPRRTGFLLARRPDLDVRPIHGNVDTRLRRLDEGATEALVLACAGLDRLGLGDRIAERLDPEVVPPAPGQGALAIQVRSDDDEMLRIVEMIDDPATRLAVETERAFLAASGGGCRAPIGALALVGDHGIDLLGGYVETDGSQVQIAHRQGSDRNGPALAAALVESLRTASARRSGSGATRPAPARPRVLVTRASDQAGALINALGRVGLAPCGVPAVGIEMTVDDDMTRALRRADACAWVVVTSSNGARAAMLGAERAAVSPAAWRWAVVGSATRQAVEGAGCAVQFQPHTSSAAALAAELPVEPGDRILLIRGNLADVGLPDVLRARGALVDDVVGYHTAVAPGSSAGLLRQTMQDGPLAAIVFTSGSTVRGLLALAGRESIDLLGVPAVCIGKETAAEATRAGFSVGAVAASPDSSTLALTVARVVRDAKASTPPGSPMRNGATS